VASVSAEHWPKNVAKTAGIAAVKTRHGCRPVAFARRSRRGRPPLRDALDPPQRAPFRLPNSQNSVHRTQAPCSRQTAPCAPSADQRRRPCCARLTPKKASANHSNHSNGCAQNQTACGRFRDRRHRRRPKRPPAGGDSERSNRPTPRWTQSTAARLRTRGRSTIASLWTDSRGPA